MLNPKDRYWVLVADSGQARILEMRRKPYACRQVSEIVSEAQHLAGRDLVSDASGRVYHTQGPGTHAMQPRSDPRENAEEQFCAGLAKKIEQAATGKRFDRLALIADARTLGRLRRALGKGTAERIVEEKALNLSRLPPNELEPRVRDILGWTT
jgi:protein required for attachment to host cells